jgi:hypothetical protein
MKQEDIDWSRERFRTLADGGVWGVPRSGLLWEKRGDELVLVARMPWIEEMPINAKQFKQQQDADIRIISEHMRAAGVKVKTDGHPQM